MDYVLYAAGASELADVAKPSALVLAEVWTELPPLRFVPMETSVGGEGLVSNSMDIYVYVPPTAAQAIKKGASFLRAIGTRQGEKKLNFFWVDPLPEDVAARAAALNALKAFNEAQIAHAPKKKSRGRP